MAEAPASYYQQPVIKDPVWTWEIPAYFFTGGLGGAGAGLAYLCELRGNESLAKRSWAVAMGGIALSPALLTSDLGKPLRFLNMLRMFKVTSPMSVGSWVLTASGATTTVATADAWLGLLPRAGRLARPAAALLGLPLSTYTAALIANTAVPVWHEARRSLPFVFGAGAALSAGAAAAAVTPPAQAGPARRLALGGAIAELILKEAMEKQLGELRSAYETGTPKKTTMLTRATLIAGGGLLAGPGRSSRAAAALAGALMCAGALSARWSIFRAGFQSASDPKQVIGPQRAAIERGERRGASRRRARVGEVERAVGSPATSLPANRQAVTGPPPTRP